MEQRVNVGDASVTVRIADWVVVFHAGMADTLRKSVEAGMPIRLAERIREHMQRLIGHELTSALEIRADEDTSGGA